MILITCPTTAIANHEKTRYFEQFPHTLAFTWTVFDQPSLIQVTSDTTPMSLNLTHAMLGWPAPKDVRNPTGEGARIFAELARAKIQNTISRRNDSQKVKIGVLSRNSEANDTEAPLAIVAEYDAKPSDQSLRELHRLAWNFSHSPTVITIEPDLLRVWTCCEPPEEGRFIGDYSVYEANFSELKKDHLTDTAKRAAQVLHWVNLVSGQFFRDNAGRFRRDRRADQMLLGNLRYIRQRLQSAGLKDDDVCHDLLARVIFVQFLFDRKDSIGNAALNGTKLKGLRESGVLKLEHDSFASILKDYDDTYQLFDWLNTLFNGDLFPGKGKTAAEREQVWNHEKRHVKPKHLELLKNFVSGDLDMPSGQLCLWPQYSFDAIPLEFISSIYEVFVSERARSEGIYYTPPHLVDFILDRVLPWNGERWDLKICDPACGSGIFLVKAFQRLIHRWKKCNANTEIRAETLRGLLEKNIFGVDKDPHAVRVASFSLYLAMCDEIDPKHYWTQVHFPTMRGRRLINADFFNENIDGFRTNTDSGTYDLIIGNAPWGGDPLTKEAREWAEKYDWPIAEKDIGTLFLPKSLQLSKPGGNVSLLQPARVLLFSQRGPAREFRNKLFSNYTAEIVVNLSALRFELFPNASDPACVVVFLASPPEVDGVVTYISPKRSVMDEDICKIVVEPVDIREITNQHAANDALIWSVLIWGGRRDLVFARRLSQLTNLERLEKDGVAQIRRGISRGDLGRTQVQIANRRILEADEFPANTFFSLDARSLPINTDERTHSRDSTNFEAFELPQMLIKQSWQKGHFRFQAAVVESNANIGPVICSRSYASIHVSKENQLILNMAWLGLKSKLAVYFLLLTSGRFAAYREEPNLEDILKVPIPLIDKPVNPSTVEEIDKIVRDAFGFKDAEWALVEDLFNVTLPDFKGDENSPGRQRTKRKAGSTEDPQLRHYCEYFIRVLKAGFGQDKPISATIFRETGKNLLPYRLIAFVLDRPSKEQICTESLEDADLLAELQALNQTWLQQQTTQCGSVYYQRVARLYDRRRKALTIFILKPDAYRYWTRSAGLHDADEVAADFGRWQASSKLGDQRK